jgi:cellulose synthase (UDP-forming)
VRKKVPQLYETSSEITGKLTNKKKVTFRNILTATDLSVLRLFLILIVTSMLSVATLLLLAVLQSFSIIALILVIAVIFVELLRLVQSLTLFIFAAKAKDPLPMKLPTGKRIAVLTTIVPGKEPLDLVSETLKKMLAINPGKGNTIDVWLLDEGDDDAVKQRCIELGINHFSRKNVPEWNQPSGPYKTKTKHGNHNAWRARYEKYYFVVAQMDPDHVPLPNFLMRTLGYFKDKDVAFVVAPQVYGNIKESWVARAAAFQAYIFHGIIQRGANGLNAPLLIGTNHLYRTAAFTEINGYQDSIIEDHLTSMVVYGTKTESGDRMKGVYTPDIIAIGEGPTSFTDYYNQQKRWAYGIWNIAMKSTPSIVRKMSKGQALSFLMLQSFYPAIAIAWTLGSLLTLIFCFAPLSLGAVALPLAAIWAVSIASSIGLFMWLRKFNLVEHEKKDRGLEGMALLLMTIPVYVNAALEALLRKPLTYAVTAKGNLASPDTLMTFSYHINWVAFNILSMTVMFFLTAAPNITNVAWVIERIGICLLPISIFVIARIKISAKKSREQKEALPQELVQASPYTSLVQSRQVKVGE